MSAEGETFITATATSSQRNKGPRAALAYRVEDAVVPDLRGGSVSVLPDTIPIDKVLHNISQNVMLRDNSSAARQTWLRDFSSPPSRALIGNLFWYTISSSFHSGKFAEEERVLFDRVAANYVELFVSIPGSRKDGFFAVYADAVSQCILYSFFLAFPKSRAHFTEAFRRDLILRISYWSAGLKPEFVRTTHWRLNLGGGDVLQSATAAGAAGGNGQLSLHDALRSLSKPTHHTARPVRVIRCSPLIAHFLKTKNFHSSSLVRPVRLAFSRGELRAERCEARHLVLTDRAANSRKEAEDALSAHLTLQRELRAEEVKSVQIATQAHKRLELRRKEALRGGEVREFANFLTSLTKLGAET